MSDVYSLIKKVLFEHQDDGYKQFTAKLCPTVDPRTIIGVRLPVLKKLAASLSRHPEIDVFLEDLPHEYFEANHLQSFIIGREKSFPKALTLCDSFLPYIDNWAVCDSFAPSVFAHHKKDLRACIEGWVSSSHTYTVRFGIGLLMRHFLDADFSRDYLERVSRINTSDYYVNMMIAWYFATALAKQYHETLPFLEQRRLSDWVHNMAIQKAVESSRVDPRRKSYLKTLKVKK